MVQSRRNPVYGVQLNRDTVAKAENLFRRSVADLMQIRGPRINARGLFYASALVLTLFKMWLTSDIRILPVWAPHDAENYVEHARAILAGAWFGLYSQMTLIKEPFYPIYLACIQELGLPLPLANLLVYAGACTLACVAIRPIVRNGLLLFAIFAVLLFNPMTFAALAWTAMRSILNDSLALLVVSCALGILIRSHEPFRALLKWWIGLGLSLAAFMLTREEAVWLLPCLALILAVFVLRTRKDAGLRWRIVGLAIPFACWLLSQSAIGKLNHHFYGWNVVVETKAPEFVSAYNAMARIVPSHYDPMIAVPKSAREIAYRVSPAARELEPSLEGPYGHNWINMLCKSSLHMCNDYAGSFFMWAFRDAVAAAGHYKTGADARAYYLRLANELDHACDTREIRCNPKALTIFPNPTVAEAPQIWSNFRDGVGMETTFSDWSAGGGGVPPNPAVDDLYAFVVRSITVDRRNYSGWIVTARPAQFSIQDAAGNPQAIEGEFGQPSPDVAAAFRKMGHPSWFSQHARFSFATSCADDCFVVATDARGHSTKIPLTQTNPNFASATVMYHLDAADDGFANYDGRLKARTLFSIDVFYHTIVPMWVWLGAALLALRLARAAVRRRLHLPSANDTLSTSVMLSGGFLILILAALTVSFSATFNPEYLGSFVPLMLFALSFATAREGLVIYRFARFRLHH